MTRQTRVLFRKDKHGVFALFPDLPWNHSGSVTCYAHIGQHGGANYNHCIRSSRPASPEDYAPLKRELEGSPYRYKLKIVKRR